MEHKIIITRKINGMHSDTQELTYTCVLPFIPFIGMSIKFANIDAYDIGVSGIISIDHLVWDLDELVWKSYDYDEVFNYSEKFMEKSKDRLQCLIDNGWKLI